MESLTLGIVHTLIPGTIYALPPTVSTLYSNDAFVDLVESNDITFTTFTTITLVEGMRRVSAAFIKDKGKFGGPIILKRK